MLFKVKIWTFHCEQLYLKDLVYININQLIVFFAYYKVKIIVLNDKEVFKESIVNIKHSKGTYYELIEHDDKHVFDIPCIKIFERENKYVDKIHILTVLQWTNTWIHVYI